MRLPYLSQVKNVGFSSTHTKPHKPSKKISSPIPVLLYCERLSWLESICLVEELLTLYLVGAMKPNQIQQPLSGKVPAEVLLGVQFDSPQDEKRAYAALDASYALGEPLALAVVNSWGYSTVAAATLAAEAERLSDELASANNLSGANMAPEIWRQLKMGLLVQAMNAPELAEARTQMRDANTAFRAAYETWSASAFKDIPDAPRQTLSARTKDLPPTVRFASDSLLLAAISAFARVSEWESCEGFSRAWSQELTGLDIKVGLPDKLLGERMWQGLNRGGPRMVKAHYALWARYYEEAGNFEPVNPADVRFVTISVPQFCADIGLKKHHKGGFRREHKQAALQLLETMAALELEASYRAPGSDVEQVLSGPLWLRDTVARQRDVRAREMDDLIGQARAEAPDQWEPVAFTFAPGAWFRNGVWRKYNHAIGKIGSGLLKLENESDQWAILIGGYLGTQIRIGHYKPLRRRVSTILRRAGLADTERGKIENSRYSEKFNVALDKLVEVGIIQSWELEGTHFVDVDIEDAESLADYSEPPLYATGDWRSQIVRFSFPAEFEVDTKRLTDAKAQAIEKARNKAKRGRPKKEDSQAPKLKSYSMQPPKSTKRNKNSDETEQLSLPTDDD